MYQLERFELRKKCKFEEHSKIHTTHFEYESRIQIEQISQI